MVRLIRRVIIILFAISLIFGVGTGVYYKLNADKTAPVIEMDQDSIEISVNDDMEAIIKGVTAKDDIDGDVSNTLTVESISNFIEENTREATIAAFDQSGNVVKVKRTVIYSDYKSPRLSLKGTLVASSTDYASILDLIKVKDCLDGNISDQVQVTSDDISSLSTAGDYKMHIQVTNSAGDSLNIPVTVTIYQNTNVSDTATIKLTKYCRYVKKGKKIDPVSYLKKIEISNKTYKWKEDEEAFVETEPSSVDASGNPVYETIPLSDITITNPVDSNKAGTYEITYRYNTTTVTGIARLVIIVGGGAK